MQLAQVGLSSPHFMRRFRQVRHPVLVLFLILELVAEPETPVGETSPEAPDTGAGATLAMVWR